MDFNFQALFSHISLTHDQMKAILQDFWRKNEENQSEIGRLQQKVVESQNENSRLRHENEKYKSENTKLRQENNEHLEDNELNQENFAMIQEEFDDLLAAEVERKTSELTKQIELSKPSCPVCLQNFDTEARQPYALSCPHMVCAHCLRPGPAQNSREGSRHPSKRCPVCRTQVTTPLKKICLNS